MRHEQWLFYRSSLSSDWCDKFVDHCTTQYEPQPATIGFNDASKPDQHRECEIRWLNKDQETNLTQLIWSYVNSANRDSFDVDCRYINDLQFTSYYGQDSGRYGWHHDVDFKNTLPFHRKLSVTIQLSDPADYTGGEFEFESTIDQLPPEHTEQGTILIFPSFYKHQVKPVTSGTRHSLVTWIEGPHWR